MSFLPQTGDRDWKTIVAAAGRPSLNDRLSFGKMTTTTASCSSIPVSQLPDPVGPPGRPARR